MNLGKGSGSRAGNALGVKREFYKELDKSVPLGFSRPRPEGESKEIPFVASICTPPHKKCREQGRSHNSSWDILHRLPKGKRGQVLGGTLKAAQERAKAAWRNRFVPVPGDGSCFWHAIRAAMGTAKSMEQLREEAGGSPGIWAVESNVQRTVQNEGLRLTLRTFEIDGTFLSIGGPWDTTLGDEGGREIELVLWTVAGDGLHFDALLPEGPEDGIVSGLGRLDFDEHMEAASHTECSGDTNNQTKSSGNRHRLYCPVPGCPKGRKTEAAGCMAPKTLRDHLNEHALGRFPGAVP